MRLPVAPLQLARRAPPSTQVIHLPGLFSAQECARILSERGRWPQVQGTGAYDSASMTEMSGRDSVVRWLPSGDLTDWMYGRVDDALRTVNDEVYGFRLTEIEPLQLGSYGPGGRFSVHADFGFLHATRQLTVAIQLSDPSTYDGGDLTFVRPTYELTTHGQARADWSEPSGTAGRGQGDATVFPAFLPHLVTPITRGIRHSLVAWVRGEPYQ